MAALPPALRDLSHDEKCDLLDALWFDIASESELLTTAQGEELDRRLADHARNPDDVIPWTQVKADILNR